MHQLSLPLSVPMLSYSAMHSLGQRLFCQIASLIKRGLAARPIHQVFCRAMNCHSIFFFSFFLLLWFETQAKKAQVQSDGIYIVYMGAAKTSSGAPKDDHNQLLSSLRKRNAVIQSYSKGFTGFAARLSAAEAQSIARQPGVVSVFPDPILNLHTTRSWDFLKYQTDEEIDDNPGSDSSSSGEETIIGILDTGIWPESKSFSDNGLGPISSRWKGTCMTGPGFPSSSCNRKLIGARYYDNPESQPSTGSPRDTLGHGTHVAATAAGSPVQGASYRGLAQGVAKGGSPGSRIAMYRVCTRVGCPGSAILKAFDDAISDGVDVLSLSLGASGGFAPELSSDPIAIGAFHAVEKGIIVVCSAGNDGPTPRTVVNVAPWILTVAATTIDRQFETDVVLGGGNKVIKGGAIHFANLQKSPVYPLIYGSSAGFNSSGGADREARNCNPGSLDDNKVKGKILVCDNNDGEYSPKEKLQTVTGQGAIGIILIDDDETVVPSIFGSNPLASVTTKDGSDILSYINSTRNPTATILPTVTISKYKPAPAIAYFSGRGPIFNSINIIKPDIAAPGVAILAAWPGNGTEKAETPLFNILSGTSMSCPHVSGIAARVKSLNPAWSPSAVRSAIMTTAIQTDNTKNAITLSSGQPATPYDFGAGEVSISGPLQPGLVYETEIIDYLQFLCNIGYNISQIKLISTSIPDQFACRNDSSTDVISNMNYPSISISNLKDKGIKKVTRNVTNVGEDESTYTVIIDAPTELDVQVIPNKLQFTKTNKKLSYEVTFNLIKSAAKEDIFGSITWTNNKYKVRSPFVASIN